MRTLDSITFDAGNFTFHGDEDGVRIWHTAAGDGIGLHYFPIPPEIPADIESLESVRLAYRTLTADSGSAIIEVETPMVDGCAAIRTIIKVPQQPHGMIYLGSVTLPFRDFSYVIKVQCEELGITGLRDSEVLGELLQTGEVRLDKRAGRGVCWDGCKIPTMLRLCRRSHGIEPKLRNMMFDFPSIRCLGSALR